MRKEIEGVVKFSRSESADCACCEGRHVYGKQVNEIDSNNWIDVNTIIRKLLTKDTENKKVKITIEIE